MTTCEQRGLFDDAIQIKFLEFHANNPHVYRKLVELARQARSIGLRKYSMNGLFERLRWHYNVETQGDPFLLNNNFRSRYTRLIEEQEPDLRDFFETRRLAA